MDASIVLTTASRPFAGRFLILAAVVLFIAVIVYIFRIKNAFSSLPRLEKPWLVLEGGVALLFLGVVIIAMKDVMEISLGYLEDFDDGIIAFSAIVILASMIMMKRAWTVTERE